MGVVKRDNKWYIKGKIKLEDGSFRDYHRLAKGCKLKREAMKYDEQFLSEFNERFEMSKSTSMTIRQLMDLYLEEKKGMKKTTTLLADEYMFNVMKDLYDLRINLVKTSTIKDFIDDFNTGDYEISYVNKIRTYLNKLFNFAKSKNFIKVNPVSAIPAYKRPDELEKEISYFTPEQWKKFEESFPKGDIVYYTICCMMYYMGMRRGEVLALKRNEDVDMEKRTIRVNKTCTQYVKGQRYIITPPKTKNSRRTIKMPSAMVSIMERYLEWYDSCYDAPSDGFLFGMDQPIIPKLIKKRFDRVCQAAELPVIRLHDLRHSHASFLINQGANIKAIADRLGNTVEEVLKTYSHLFMQTEDELVRLIDSEFK